MNRKSTQIGSARRKGLAARVALAAALAGGIAVAGAAVPTAAFAKDQPKAEGNSKAFADAYAPFQAAVNNAATPPASIKAMIPTVTAAVQNNADKDTLGRALIAFGSKTNDTAIQQQGIQLAIDSGKATPQQLGVYHFFLGKFAYDAKDFARARTEFQAAQQAGYTENDPRPAIAETYFSAGQNAEGLQYLSDLIKQEQAAGRKAPSEWVIRGLKAAYQMKSMPQTIEYSQMLLRNDPSQEHWLDALQVVRVLGQFDEQSDLDLLRLMRATGTLKTRADYVSYVQEADPRRVAGEVNAVLDEGVKAGALTTSDQVYTEAKATATSRGAEDRKDIASLDASARSAATGVTAQGAGDVYYSFGDFAKAAELYKLALDKGVKERDMVLTRLGISQIQAGQAAAGKATLQQVGGTRAPIAKMWMAYADTKGAGAA